MTFSHQERQRFRQFSGDIPRNLLPVPPLKNRLNIKINNNNVYLNSLNNILFNKMEFDFFNKSKILISKYVLDYIINYLLKFKIYIYKFTWFQFL